MSATPTTPEQPTFTLNNGKIFPVIGLGTWNGREGECEEMVHSAIKVGYRHIDTAAIYGNEEAVGVGIARALDEGIVTREELFVVTKVWQDRHGDVAAAMDESLKRLGLDYVDLYLVHWPVAWQKGTKLVDETITLEQVWRSMEELVDTGKTKSIGVSNYNIEEINALVNYARIQPVINQVEIHPYFNNFALQKCCNDHKIFLTAYSALMPFSSDYKFTEWVDITADPIVQEVAQKHKISPQQVLLRWQLEVGNSVITKSSKMERLKQNFAIIELKLDGEDVAKLNTLGKSKRYRNPHAFKMPVEQWFFKDE